MVTAFFLQVWEYVKRHWSVFVLAGLVVLGYFMYHRQHVSFADQLKQVQGIHTEEINKINVARAQEEQQHAANVKALQDNLDQAQRQYDSAKAALDANKKSQASAIVKQYGNDPVGLAQKLSEVTGFRIINP